MDANNPVRYIAKEIRQTLRAKHGAQWQTLGPITDALIAERVLYVVLAQCDSGIVSLKSAQELARGILQQFEPE